MPPGVPPPRETCARRCSSTQRTGEVGARLTLGGQFEVGRGDGTGAACW
jgi:hypothetical protein